jgi:hypothetical protein
VQPDHKPLWRQGWQQSPLADCAHARCIGLAWLQHPGSLLCLGCAGTCGRFKQKACVAGCAPRFVLNMTNLVFCPVPQYMTEATFNWRMMKTICTELHVYDEEVNYKPFDSVPVSPALNNSLQV